MSSVFGNNLKLSLFGESGGGEIGGTLHDFPAGVPYNPDRAKLYLKLYQGSNNFTSARKAEELPRIVSGVTNGMTNGAPITVLFGSRDECAAPSRTHTDYVAEARYAFGAAGHMSGRLSLPMIFFGSLCADYLSARGIEIASHIKCIGDVYDEFFGMEIDRVLIDRLNSSPIATISSEQRKKMVSLMTSVAATGDCIGGAVETAIVGLPAGYGSPIFDNLMSRISAILFSLPAVRSVSFGHGAKFAHVRGSEVADLYSVSENGGITSPTNFNGGLNGGISNGMPIIIATAFKPLASSLEDETPEIADNNKLVNIAAKSDVAVCAATKGTIVASSVTAIAVMDAYLEGNGYKNLFLPQETPEPAENCEATE